MPRRPKRSHNGGPPLDDHDGPPWGKGDAYIFLAWRAAHDRAWKAPSQAVMVMRLERAERLGLTYEEYTLEILGVGAISARTTPTGSPKSGGRVGAGGSAISNDLFPMPDRMENTSMNALEIQALAEDAATVAMLADLLIETVAAGGSVSFMHPLSPEAARDFWRKSLAAAARGERAVLGAWRDGVLAGTVTLLLDLPPNQPHRAEIAKLMTGRGYRGKGIAISLMRAAEELAVEKGRTLLVLDTASEEGAAGLYEKLGFTLTGEIPDFALKPHGGLTGTLIYWKRIGAGARALS